MLMHVLAQLSSHSLILTTILARMRSCNSRELGHKPVVAGMTAQVGMFVHKPVVAGMAAHLET